MELRSAMGLCPGDVVALIGGGGKTTLATLLATATGSIFTTTTKIRPPAGMPTVLLDEGGRLDALPDGPLCVAARRGPEGKLIGVTPDVVAALREAALRRGFGGRPDLPGAVLVEADGSAGRPLKAPDAHEPLIPACATLVVPVAGATAFGRPVAEMHRAHLVAVAAGVEQAAPVTPAVVNRALWACLRGAPPGARVAAVLNQCDLLAGEAAPGVSLAKAQQALRGFDRGVLVAEGAPVATTGEVAAVVLAAGAARRFGAPKQLAPFGGRTLLEVSLRAPLLAGLAKVVVVSGATDLAHVMAPYPVELVRHSDWAAGMSTSLRAGLLALPPTIQAAIFCMCDQPWLPPTVIRSLVDAWRAGAKIAAPTVGGERRNPVLFDRSLWPELLALTGDEGGRPVLRRHAEKIVTVPWADGSLFRDVDTTADLTGEQGW